MLTAGIVANIQSIQQTSYVQQLSQSPGVATQLGSFDEANTLVTLNTPEMKARIADQAQQQFETLPEAAREQVTAEFKAEQDEFSGKLTQAFSDSLHQIFMVASGLMVIATAAAFFLKERPLRQAKADEAPGIVE
jgi:hypothetical protein